MNRKLTAIFFILLLLAGATESRAAEVRTIIVGTQADNAGTSYLDEKGRLTGFEVEVLREIARRLPEYSFEFKTMDFATLFIELGAKKVDVITSNIAWTPERAEKYLFTKENFYGTPYKIVLKGNDDSIKSFQDLAGRKIGVLGTALQAKLLADYVQKHKIATEIVPAKSNTELVSLLFADRVDALLLPEHQAVVFKKYRDRDLKAVGRGIAQPNTTPEQAGAHLLLDKSDLALRDRLDWALQEMRKDGALNRISLAWFDQDFTVPFEVEE
ncbi:MAG: transporter substrate-binding domain-containing protein [Deltaproteobacteria bacterium]|jgi:L-cystine transport system substrate-binding protein|nr:transporter substrate-binding domain-containing protein [Deltaproteobacteria bacterium]